MPKSDRMQRLANLADSAEQRAAKAVQAADDEARRLRQQAADLERYRDEYLAPMSGGAAVPLAGYEIQKLRVFVGKLDGAIGMVWKKIEQADAALSRAQAEWQAQRQRTQLLTKVADRARVDEDARAERSLQREIDDRPRPVAR